MFLRGACHFCVPRSGRDPVHRAPVGTHVLCSEGKNRHSRACAKAFVGQIQGTMNWARAQMADHGTIFCFVGQIQGTMSWAPTEMHHVGAALSVKIWCLLGRLPLLSIVAEDDERRVLTFD